MSSDPVEEDPVDEPSAVVGDAGVGVLSWSSRAGRRRTPVRWSTSGCLPRSAASWVTFGAPVASRVHPWPVMTASFWTSTSRTAVFAAPGSVRHQVSRGRAFTWAQDSPLNLSTTPMEQAKERSPCRRRAWVQNPMMAGVVEARLVELLVLLLISSI